MWKFSLINLGCKVNSYETQLLFSQISQHYLIDDEHPDVIIINSCVVTKVAENKSAKKVRQIRTKFPNSIIALIGCYPQLSIENSAKLPVDIIIKNAGKEDSFSLIEQFLQNKQRIIHDVPFAPLYPKQCCGHQIKTRMQVKIADGCNHRCSYCIVNKIRGPFRSRPVSDILKEINQAVAGGVNEIVLTGIDTGSYGIDISSSLCLLIKEILDKTTLNRLRISSIEASQIDQQLINLIISSPRIAKHLHIPLQSGSDDVLKKMNRHYLSANYLQVIKKLQQNNITITTDIIAGFPTESDADFAATLAVVKQAQFLKIHAFPYSLRPQTIASSMPQVPVAIKKMRAQQLQILGAQISQEVIATFKDKTLSILVEEIVDGIAYGYSSEYIKIAFQGDQVAVNKFYDVVIDQVNKSNVSGKLIGQSLICQ